MAELQSPFLFHSQIIHAHLVTAELFFPTKISSKKLEKVNVIDFSESNCCCLIQFVNATCYFNGQWMEMFI